MSRLNQKKSTKQKKRHMYMFTLSQKTSETQLIETTQKLIPPLHATHATCLLASPPPRRPRPLALDWMKASNSLVVAVMSWGSPSLWH